MIKYLRLMRIKHWIKNLLLFFPIIFSGRLLKRDILFYVMEGFFAFCINASAIYIFNDLKDIKNDRKSPKKKNRPLVSGEISKNGAVILIGILMLTNCIMFFTCGLKWMFWGYLVCYVFINILYSMGLKNVPIADVTILSSGYVLRIFGGGVLANTGVSTWMFLTALSAAFYLGFGKRRNELLQYGDKGREILKKYTIGFLDKSIQMFLTLTIVFYSLCCVDENTFVAHEGINLLWSVPVVILILLRYNLLLESESDGDPVEVLQQDKILILLIIFYAISVLVLIYGNKLVMY